MFTAKRREDWADRLHAVVDEHRNGPGFEWGQYDCAVLFSDAVWAMTDVDPFAAFGQWRSERGALKALAKTGHNTVRDFIAAEFTEIAPSFARRGDVGFSEPTATLTSPAVVVGAEAVSWTESGWLVLPLSSLVVAYRVG